MKYEVIFFLALSLVQFNWQCAPESGDVKRKEQMAEGYCECASTIAALDARAKLQADSSVFLTAMLDSMQREVEKATACLGLLRTETGLLKQAEIPEFQRVLQSKCPALAQNKELIMELLCR
jgi:hypothetical protein